MAKVPCSQGKEGEYSIGAGIWQPNFHCPQPLALLIESMAHLWGWDVTQLIECLPTIHKALDLVPSMAQTGQGNTICNLALVGAGG